MSFQGPSKKSRSGRWPPRTPRRRIGSPSAGSAPRAASPFRLHGLARWLAKFGLMSRTEAEACVRAGRVTVNGHTVRDPERPSHPSRDAITLDGRPLRPALKVYIAMHKPRGCITTARDPEGRPTVYDLLPPLPARVQAVGRLDADSSGLLLFSNDTEFAAKVSDGRGGVEKAYRVLLEGRLSPEDARSFERGVELDGRRTRPAACRILVASERETRVEVVVTEGRNRQVRRMWWALGYRVIDLERVRIGPVLLGDLPPGKTRKLTEAERAEIEAAVQLERGRPRS